MPVARAARPAARTPRGPGRSAARAVLAAHHDEANEEIYGIAELSREFGISPRAIRFYEAKGLLKPRRVNGARVYTRRDRARLSLILRAKAIGSSLAEIRHYLDLYGSRGEGRVAQLRYVLARTDEAIGELEQRRTHIETTLAELRLINDTVRGHLEGKA
ncbi:MAG: MerR family DNA-binding transcriptional regulator [Steroidobacteraceae bacterium]